MSEGAASALQVPAQEGRGEYQDRGSRFIAWVFDLENQAGFLSRLEELRLEHGKARHHCWAWKIGPDYRFNDDGEPGGTAGRPMLQVLEGGGYHRVAAVCVRYFGGVKLGTGGLVRAYGGATARAVECAGMRRLPRFACLDLRLPFSLLGLRGEMESLFPGIVFAGDFDSAGWSGQATLEEEQVERLSAFLGDRGKGQVHCQRVDNQGGIPG